MRFPALFFVAVMSAAAASAAAVGLSAAPSEPVPGPVTAITGATLVDVRSGDEIGNSVVIIRGERIVQAGAKAKVAIPADARVIDARGKWLLPGLIDMHVHLWDTDRLPLGLFLANGVTTVRDTGFSVLIMRLTGEELSSGKRIGPRLYFCGDLLDGQPPLYRDSTLLVDTPERARSAVNFLADQGVDCIKVYNNVKEPELKEIIRTAHERHLPVTGHVPRTLTMTHAVELGMQGLEHIRITGREMLSLEEADAIDFLPLGKREPLLWQRFDPESEKMKALASFLAKSRVFLDPTLVADQSDFALSWDDQVSNRDNRYLPRPLFEKWKADGLPDFATVPAESKQSARDGFEKRKRFVGMCRRAGVRVIAGSDGAGLGTLLPGFGLQHELRLLVDSGLTPLEAIQAATVESAAALGKPHDLGLVEPGYLADMVLVGADPLETIDNTRKIDLVVAAGRAYKPADLLSSSVESAGAPSDTSR